MPTILVVDDNARLFQSLKRNFESEHFETLWASNGMEASTLLAEGGVSLVLLDLKVGEEDGVSILSELQAIDREVPIIMITGFATVESAVQSLKLGAIDYVKKPLDFDRLLSIVQKAIERSDLQRENRELKDQLKELRPRLVVHNPVMAEILRKIKMLAVTRLPILIVGESGTGKELIADAIHAASPRSFRAMVKVNCAAFPETLLDNELFGHEKGAYTGADSVFKGVFERAESGSLFLDEIGDMPLPIQAKILRTLQNSEVRRIGGTSTFNVDVRLIAATNRDPMELVQEGKFRSDLYYRISTAVINVPPLRERTDDVYELATQFALDYARTNTLPSKRFSDKVVSLFQRYGWPGNARELRNVVNYACAVSADDEIRVSDLPPSFPRDDTVPTSLSVRDAAERDLILRTLRQQDHNKKRTAEVLGISRRTLYNRLLRYGYTEASQ